MLVDSLGLYSGLRVFVCPPRKALGLPVNSLSKLAQLEPRAAERAAPKAAQKANLQAIASAAITAQPNKASAATTASLLAGDNHAIINNNVPTDNPEVITEVMNETPKSLGSRTAASKKISSCMSEKPSASKIDRLRDAPLGLRLFFSAIPVFILYKVLIAQEPVHFGRGRPIIPKPEGWLSVIGTCGPLLYTVWKGVRLSDFHFKKDPPISLFGESAYRR